MEIFLRAVLLKILGDAATFQIYTHRGKTDLMAKLEQRLRGYAKWLPPSSRIIVIVDRDGEDCIALKRCLEQAAMDAGLSTRAETFPSDWQVATRIAIEELEAWYFGEWRAVRSAYDRLSVDIPRKARYRQPDAIRGGTWEALERELRRQGYFETGLRKAELAQAVGQHFDPSVCTSPSFASFQQAVLEAIRS